MDLHAEGEHAVRKTYTRYRHVCQPLSCCWKQLPRQKDIWFLVRLFYVNHALWCDRPVRISGTFILRMSTSNRQSVRPSIRTSVLRTLVSDAPPCLAYRTYILVVRTCLPVCQLQAHVYRRTERERFPIPPLPPPRRRHTDGWMDGRTEGRLAV